jgi:hypothetical protein
MTERSTPDGSRGEQPVTFTMEIQNGRTEIRVTGDRDTCVVVESASGETIYLSPEDFDRTAESGESTYGGPAESGGSTYDSPYEAGSGSQESPYTTRPSTEAVTGMEPTDNGYLVVHPEPVTDLRFLR